MRFAFIGRLLVVVSLFGLAGCGARKSTAEDTAPNESSIKAPATVQQAAQILDLSKIPLMEGAQAPGSRQVANLSYLANGDTRSVFEFHRKALLAQAWKELPNSSVTDQSASAIFGRSGFVVSLAAYPNGQSGNVAVRLQNHGNIKPGQLPVPPGTKPVYVGDSTAMYSTETALPATAEAVRNLFLAQGWIVYGSAGDSAFYKQNAILVTATASVAPAQGGKTMIQYSSQLISADIPAPRPDAEDQRYVDTPPTLSFGTASNQDAVIDFYRKALAPAGWESTLDHTVEISDKPTMIFRNPAKDMLTLSFYKPARGKMPVDLRFQSAAEIAELDRQIEKEAPAIRAAAEAKAKKEATVLAEANKVLKVPVTLPADAKDVQQPGKDEIKFTVGKGKAKAAAETLRAQFREAGWKEDFATLDAVAGALSFSKEKGSLTISYTDTGVMPSEVTLSAMRAELERR